ncbi:MAG TPA: site-specific integrase [Gaiellaceae bacterium]
MSLRLSEAVDLYVGDMERRSLAPRTVYAYRRKLDVLCALNERRDVTEIGPDDCRRALDQWRGRSAGTIAHSVTVFSTFFRSLYEDGASRPTRCSASDDLDCRCRRSLMCRL